MHRGQSPLREVLSLTVAAVVLVAAGGCLPSSCSRVESRAVTPADSTSREIARSIPVDTLELVWSVRGTDTGDFEYPRTLLFDTTGVLWMSDAGADIVCRFDPAGGHLGTLTSALFSYPFMAGVAGDSVFVFSPGRQRLLRIFENRVYDFLPTPSPPKKGLLQYAHVDRDGRAFVKLLGEDFTGYVAAQLTEDSLRWKRELAGPAWRWAGGLTSWGDTLLSLRGYQPVVDLFLEDGSRDSLRLTGFDSPMLSRSRLFARGEIDTPPLLSASAVPFGNELFVLNMRPGWLRIDVYDRAGMLKRILVQPDPGFNRDFYPTDIAVTRTRPSVTEIAVSLVEPEARLDYYRWRHPFPTDRFH